MNAEELVRLYRRVGAVIAIIRFNYRRGFRVRAQYAPHNIPVRTNIVSELIALGTCENNIDKTLSVVTRQCAGLP
jgi:hypothetical protein